VLLGGGGHATFPALVLRLAESFKVRECGAAHKSKTRVIDQMVNTYYHSRFSVGANVFTRRADQALRMEPR
jgi:uncharacterized protein (DUF2252 family)